MLASEKITKLFKPILTKYKIPNEAFRLENPKIISNGHYSTNLAFLIAKINSKKPSEVGEALINELNMNKLFKKVEVTPNGFINFYLSNLQIQNEINELNKTKELITFKKLNKKVNLELVSANPTGYLHIGHARIATIGLVLSNVAKKIYKNVDKWYYINDAGNQMQNLAKSLHSKYLLSQNKKNIYALDDDLYKGKEIDFALNEFIKKSKTEPTLQNLESFAYKYFLKDIKSDLNSIGLKIDKWISEKEILKNSNSFFTLLEKHKFTYKADNSLWAKTTLFGDDKDRVLIKSDKTFTYVVADSILHINKNKFNYDEIFNLFGSDHFGYFTRIIAIMKSLGIDTTKFKVQYVQMVRLNSENGEVKMSKRAGTSYWFKTLLSEVGADAMKFYLISQLTNSILDFNIDLSKNNSSQNPYYYVQYAHARCHQVLNKAKKHKKFIENTPYQYSDIEIELLLKISKIKDTVEKAWANKEPHLIYIFLIDLAKLFHSFYNSSPVLNDNKQIFEARKSLVKLTKKTICELFQLIEIKPLNVL